MGQWLRNEAGGLGDLDGLGAAPGAELVEEAAGMSFDSVFADEEAGGDFAVAEAGGDEAEDLEFARGDGELGEAGFVGDEGLGGLRGEFLDDDGWLFAGEGEAEPDAESGEEGGNQGAINFYGVFDDQEAVFGEF